MRACMHACMPGPASFTDRTAQTPNVVTILLSQLKQYTGQAKRQMRDARGRETAPQPAQRGRIRAMQPRYASALCNRAMHPRYATALCNRAMHPRYATALCYRATTRRHGVDARVCWTSGGPQKAAACGERRRACAPAAAIGAHVGGVTGGERGRNGGAHAGNGEALPRCLVAAENVRCEVAKVTQL